MRQFLFVILFACSYIGLAQHYPIVAYTNREGLAQMQVTNVLEDSRGYIWAITKGGLSKFDGERFESFYRQDGLKYQTNLEGLSEDSKGNIWLMYSRLGLENLMEKLSLIICLSHQHYLILLSTKEQ